MSFAAGNVALQVSGNPKAPSGLRSAESQAAGDCMCWGVLLFFSFSDSPSPLAILIHPPLRPGPPLPPTPAQLYYPATLTAGAAILAALTQAATAALPASQLLVAPEDRGRVMRDFRVSMPVGVGDGALWRALGRQGS